MTGVLPVNNLRRVMHFIGNKCQICISITLIAKYVPQLILNLVQKKGLVLTPPKTPKQDFPAMYKVVQHLCRNKMS